MPSSLFRSERVAEAQFCIRVGEAEMVVRKNDTDTADWIAANKFLLKACMQILCYFDSKVRVLSLQVI